MQYQHACVSAVEEEEVGSLGLIGTSMVGVRVELLRYVLRKPRGHGIAATLRYALHISEYQCGSCEVMSWS